jgi:hypothetical protein
MSTIFRLPVRPTDEYGPYRLFNFIVFILVVAVTAQCASATNIYVAPGGSDTNPGTEDLPLATLHAAAPKLKPGDTMWIRGGTYLEPLRIDGLQGTAELPIVVRAYPGETVVLDGTQQIQAEWTAWQHGIFKAKLTHDIWQLFDGQTPFDLARWPNASINDGSVWNRHLSMRSTDRNWINKLGRSDSVTQPGVILDKNRADPGANSQTLAETGVDFTGAVAVLNIGHWRTWARPILSHEKGSNRFTFDSTKTQMKKFLEYYIYGLQALDHENEWWFDSATKTIYLKPKSGLHPSELKLKGKVRNFNLRAHNCKHVQFIGIDFFATAFGLTECSDVLIEDCNLLYPSTHKFMLGELNWVGRRSRADGANAMAFIYNYGEGPFNNVVRNCSIEYPNAPAIGLFSPGSVLDNCYIHDVEWDVNSSGGSGAIPGGPRTIVRNCTVHTTGGSEGIRIGHGSTIEGNRIYNTSLLQHDGSAINIGVAAQPGTVVSRNWAYNTHSQAIRFDSTGSTYGTNACVIGNVFFNVGGNGGNKFKGDYHLFANNTAFDCFVAIPKGFGNTDVHNRHSIVQNNLIDRLVEWNLSNRMDGITARLNANVKGEGVVRRLLRDPDNFDFRPRRSAAALIDSGLQIQRDELPGKTIRLPKLGFAGKSPDVGAYECNASSYWIPGCKVAKASFPVPPHESQTVKSDADLMWLHGRDAVAHDVYVARTKEEAEAADGNSTSLLASETGIKNNIFGLGKLEPGQTYYWRVDVIKPDRARIKGDVWNFRVAP